MPKNIAILIPVFNGEKYLKSLLESVSKSIAAGREKLVCGIYLADDFSSDDTIAIAERHWNSDVPLKVLRNSANLGEYGNANQAVEKMKGDNIDWFLTIHHDDIAKPAWISQMAQHIQSADEKLGAISCASSQLFERDNGEHQYFEHPTQQARTGDILHFGNPQGLAAFRDQIFWVMSGSAIRIQAFEDAGRFPSDLKSGGDYVVPARILRSGWNILELSSPLVIRRFHQTNATRILANIYHLEGFLSLYEIFDEVTPRSRKIFSYMRILEASTRLTLFGKTSALRRKSFWTALKALRCAIKSLRKQPSRTDG